MNGIWSYIRCIVNPFCECSYHQFHKGGGDGEEEGGRGGGPGVTTPVDFFPNDVFLFVHFHLGRSWRDRTTTLVVANTIDTDTNTNGNHTKNNNDNELYRIYCSTNSDDDNIGRNVVSPDQITMDVSSLEAVVASAISPAITSPSATDTSSSIDCDNMVCHPHHNRNCLDWNRYQ